MSASPLRMDIPLSTNPAANENTAPATVTRVPFSLAQWLGIGLLFAIPAVIVLAKSPGAPTSEALTQAVSLSGLPERVQHRIDHVLFIPMAATLVVLCRLTLGLRVLGPFRSILLAVAFQVTGIVLGLVFLAGTIAVVLGIRPSVGRLSLPYFGRITVVLSIVSLIMVAALMAGQWLDWDALHTVAYFPIVVLCLVSDAFAKVVDREGLKSALWRGSITALVAIVLTVLASLPPLKSLMIYYPELLVFQVGCLVVVSKCFAWRLFASLNPAVSGEDDEHEFDENDFDEPARTGAAERHPAAAARRSQEEQESLAL